MLKINSIIPPDKGTLFFSINNWCLSPVKLCKKLFLLRKKFIQTINNGIINRYEKFIIFLNNLNLIKKDNKKILKN